jgi:hypothetical protein
MDGEATFAQSDEDLRAVRHFVSRVWTRSVVRHDQYEPGTEIVVCRVGPRIVGTFRVGEDGGVLRFDQAVISQSDAWLPLVAFGREMAGPKELCRLEITLPGHIIHAVESLMEAKFPGVWQVVADEDGLAFRLGIDLTH